MMELYELKSKLIDELKDYGKRDVSGSNLATIDTLAHAVKNLCKVIDDDEYSGHYPWDERSYRRDGMGRYSREYSRSDLKDKLRELMNEARDDHTRMEIKRLIDKMD